MSSSLTPLVNRRKPTAPGPDGLTDAQREVLSFIEEKIEDRGYGPTIREINERFGTTSPNGVICHLTALQKKGRITRDPNRSRAITVILTEEQRERKSLLAKLSTLTTEDLRDVVAERFGDTS